MIDSHATLVSGVIAASKNDQGSIGGLEATLSGVGLGSGDNVQVDALNDFADQFKNYDIVNNSWGFETRLLSAYRMTIH